MSRESSRRVLAKAGSFLQREVRTIREPFRLLWNWRRVRQVPTGQGGVMVIPGFTANDLVMFWLRFYLRRRGYVVWGWGLGTNLGRVERNLPKMIGQVQARVDENGGQPIALVGWSMGGVFARAVARDRPDLVTQVITMATPVHGYSQVTKFDLPITAFYSKRDGVVDWRNCIDDINPQARMVEVESSHLGIILDPTVWIGMANRLAEVEATSERAASASTTESPSRR